MPPCLRAPIHRPAFLGACVVFRRDVLVSVGGQAYGSITEVIKGMLGSRMTCPVAN